ncbi:MAG: CoA-binding protein [Desulfurococcaceae archaeon]|nr:CoA-binding protein [Desulfurococcaceae archaeon]
MSSAIRLFFEPESVAVIGASRDPSKTGHVILKNIVEGGYKGRIYPINPSANEILGLKCYKSVLEVPENIDLAVVVVPARLVPSVIDELGVKKVKAAVIISGGFRETGTQEGRRLEEELKNKAISNNVRVLGPNCQGVNNPHVGLCASWPLIRSRGPLAIVSQSGTIAAAFELWAEEEGIGVSKMAALGNKIDVDETDLLEYLRDDAETRAIAMYIESIRDGRRFLRVATETSLKKPVVVLKSGRTPSGVRAVASHTGSLAGSYAIYYSAFRKAGIAVADTIEELYDIAKGLALLPRTDGERIQIVTSSGGSGIVSVDYAEMLGLRLASLEESSRESLRSELPTHCIVGNPLDLTGDADAERYDKVLKVLVKDPNIDVILTIFGDPIPGASEVIKKWFNSGKTIVPVYIGGGSVEVVERRKMHESRIPTFKTPERAVKVVKALVDYTRFLRMHQAS